MPGSLGIIFAMKDIVLLGSTGSIGTQALDVAKKHNITVKALCAKKNVKLLAQQARQFKPEAVCIADKNCYPELKMLLADMDIKILCGNEGVCELAQLSCDMVVNAIVGMIGLLPTISAIKAKNRIGLANKETLVVGGEIVTRLAKENGVDIIPIDSEHSAIFQALQGNSQNKISKILLTASGGPFFGYKKDQLQSVTLEQALNHPNWNMGAKITTDSATMMNKGLELIEAVWLFGVKPNDVEILIHRQSVLHSAVEFEDGSVIGQMGVPDMRIPIQYALTYPKRLPSSAERLDLFKISELTFAKPDFETFTLLDCAKTAIEKGGNLPCIMNCANEAAVSLFLERKISFYRIFELVSQAMSELTFEPELTLDVIKETEKAAREFVLSR